jgi:antitoxin component YwqK of YwqJK toxin-antitoxin module
MNYLAKFFLLLVFIKLVSCERSDDAPVSEAWQGNEESFENEFTYQLDVVHDSTILTHKISNELYSGVVEINQSGRITEQNYSLGRLDGKSVKKSPDGSWVEAHYVEGKLEGPMIFYDRSGKIRSTLNYSNGNLQPSKAR